RVWFQNPAARSFSLSLGPGVIINPSQLDPSDIKSLCSEHVSKLGMYNTPRGLVIKGLDLSITLGIFKGTVIKKFRNPELQKRNHIGALDCTVECVCVCLT